MVYRKLTGVWRLLSLKLMELTTLILRRFISLCIYIPNLIEQLVGCGVLLTNLLYLEQLELLIATLIDLDAMDGKSSVSLLAECSNSPDVNTR